MAETRRFKTVCFRSAINRFIANETGTTALEYTLILTILGAVLIVIFDAMAESSETMWNNIDTEIDEAI